jgi:acetyl esterase/lipase
MTRKSLQVAALVLLWISPACGPGFRPPLKPFYSNAELDPTAAEVRLDVPYRTDDDAHPAKHRLDLFLPSGRGWPMLAFAHGGSLEKGDSAQQVVGHDIYRNIGRFYAARGVGVALINYRLQPDVNWVGQAGDVATAIAWLTPRLEELGGDGRLYLSGHSAGSWLMGHVALDDALQARHGVDPEEITAVILISGSGFDLTDDLTWELFGREKLWQRRFSIQPDDPHWKDRASIIPHLGGDPPPFLLLYASDEWPALVRQNKLMCEALAATPSGCRIAEIEGLGHRRMLLAVSHADKPVSVRILAALGVRGAEASPDPRITETPR